MQSNKDHAVYSDSCLAQTQSASPKAAMLYVHNMSLFLVACLPNRWQRASSANFSLEAH
jgi:hypothetical protein